MSAIVSSLWEKNSEVIERYLGSVPSLVYVPGPRPPMANGGSMAFLDELVDEETRGAVVAEADARATTFQVALARDAFEDAPLDAATIRTAVAEDLQGRLERAMLLVAALDAAHERTPIELAVLNEDLTASGRTIAEWARARAVPCVVVSHSCILGRLYTVHKAVNADEVVVFGERGAQAFRDARIDSGRLVSLANPAWDRYRFDDAAKQVIRASVRSQYGWSPSDPLVVFGTTWAAKLTAFEDDVVESSLHALFAAVAEARESFPKLRVLVKGRHAGAREQELLARIGPEHGVADYAYTMGGLEQLVTAADLVVSVNSNLSIEATLAGVPAINLWTPMSWALGPFFGATDGILDSVPDRLGNAIVLLLREPALGRALVAAATQRLSLLGGIPDGTAAVRLAQHLARKRMSSSNPAPSAERYVWQELSAPAKAGVKALDGSYNTNVRRELFPLLSETPKVVLEIGCASGGTAAALKAEHGAFAVGVERDPETAAIASTRLDAVVTADAGDIDAIRASLDGRTVDTLILADVLEHLYDPWLTLVKLRELLSPRAQVIASIPNSRNLWLMNELAEGRWAYGLEGLLDVTHIRFFTLREITRMFTETGYRIEAVSRVIDARAGSVNLDFAGLQDIRAGRISLHGISAQDLAELTTLQFLLRARIAH